MNTPRFNLVKDTGGKVLTDMSVTTRVDHPNQLVRLDLGNDAVRWVGLNRDMALELARLLLTSALNLRPPVK